MSRHRYGDAMRNLDRFMTAHKLNLYTGFGEAWDEDERPLAGGREVWWAKFVPDVPHGKRKPRAIATGIGETAAEAVGKARAEAVRVLGV